MRIASGSCRRSNWSVGSKPCCIISWTTVGGMWPMYVSPRCSFATFAGSTSKPSTGKPARTKACARGQADVAQSDDADPGVLASILASND